MNKEKILKKNKLFSQVPSKVIKSICSLFHEYNLKRGESIIEESLPNDTFFIICKGKVKIICEHHYEHELGPGNYFCELAILEEKSRVVAAFAVQVNTELLSIKRADFMNCLQAFPIISTVITHILADRLCEIGLAGYKHQIGNYTITRGLVLSNREIWFKAKHSYLEKTLRIQLIPHLVMRDEKYKEQLRNKLRLLANLNYSFILKPIDVVEIYETVFIVYDYADGIPLSEVLSRTSTLPPAIILNLLLRLANYLSILHKEEIIHGDLRPENIFLTKEGELKLANLGILHPSLLIPQYLAPEQLQKKYSSKSSDIYALGILVYLLACAKFPFDAQEEDLLLKQKTEFHYTPLEEINPALPLAVSCFVRRALEPRRDKRLDYLGNLGEMLETWEKENKKNTAPLNLDYSAALLKTWLEKKKIWPFEDEDAENKSKSYLANSYISTIKDRQESQFINFSNPEEQIAFYLLTFEDFIQEQFLLKGLKSEEGLSKEEVFQRLQNLEQERQNFCLIHTFFKVIQNCQDRKNALQAVLRLLEFSERAKNYALLVRKEKRIKNQAERLIAGYNYLLDNNSDQLIFEKAEKENAPFISREKNCYVLICPLIAKGRLIGIICLSERLRKDLESKLHFYSLLADVFSISEGD